MNGQTFDMRLVCVDMQHMGRNISMFLDIKEIKSKQTLMSLRRCRASSTGHHCLIGWCLSTVGSAHSGITLFPSDLCDRCLLLALGIVSRPILHPDSTVAVIRLGQDDTDISL